ncbi:MAG: Rpn family recombination-promoting nuclease/putative transposase [Desulfatirhabdiaceae bacterium]
MCRINPRVDFAFKKLFGSEENKDLLISLINSMVRERDQVADLELKNPYSLAAYREGKLSILDIRARDAKGRWFNVEMQISEDRNIDKRAIYYWSKLVTEQLAEGMMYKELKKTISINILNFDFTPGTEEYHSIYRIINERTGVDDNLHDMFELHYLELLKFRKDYGDIGTTLDRWTAFLSRAHLLDRDNLPKSMREDAHILKAVAAVDRMFDEEERQIYEIRMQAYADVESRIGSAFDHGKEIGREEGREEGIEIGLDKARRELAGKLLDVLDDETIALKTGLKMAEIVLLRTVGR